MMMMVMMMMMMMMMMVVVVGWSVGWSVMLSSKSMKNGLLRILNDLDSAGRGKKRDKEEGGARRKEGQGGRMDRRKEGRGGRTDEESEKMKKLLKKMKNEKVAKGRIIGLAGPCLFLFYCKIKTNKIPLRKKSIRC